MKFALALAAALLAIPTSVSAQSMTAAEFLAKAEEMIRSGNRASDSPQMRVLRDAGLAAANAVRAQQRGDRQAGRPATLCMPEKVGLEAAEFIGHLTSIPRERRDVPLVDAFAHFMRIKFPCPARG